MHVKPSLPKVDWPTESDAFFPWLLKSELLRTDVLKVVTALR